MIRSVKYLSPCSWYRIRHDMGVLCALLALCEGNPPVTGGFPSQRVSNTRLFFAVILNKVPKQTGKWIMIWNSVMLMWCPCYEILTYTSLHLVNVLAADVLMTSSWPHTMSMGHIALATITWTTKPVPDIPLVKSLQCTKPCIWRLDTSNQSSLSEYQDNSYKKEFQVIFCKI